MDKKKREILREKYAGSFDGKRNQGATTKKEIPALTKSGGFLSSFGGEKAVLEYRLWFHYHDGREDEYYKADNLDDLLEKRKVLLEDKTIALVEHPIAVVKDKDYREVRIDGIDYN